MSFASADFEFSCILTTILSWRHGSLIHQEHKETILGLPMSSVLQRGPGKCDHPLMTLGLQESNHDRYNRDPGTVPYRKLTHSVCWIFPDVCDILHLRSLLFIEAALASLAQILHRIIFLFIDGYVHHVQLVSESFILLMTHNEILSSAHMCHIIYLFRSDALMATSMYRHTRKHPHERIDIRRCTHKHSHTINIHIHTYKHSHRSSRYQ